MRDLDILAATAYETGIDPIDYAVANVVQAHVNAHLAVTAVLDRHHLQCSECGLDMAANPCDGCARDLSTSALACRIVAGMLSAGWTPPEVTR